MSEGCGGSSGLLFSSSAKVWIPQAIQCAIHIGDLGLFNHRKAAVLRIIFSFYFNTLWAVVKTASGVLPAGRRILRGVLVLRRFPSLGKRRFRASADASH
jgi:hypothetical protein